jgi:large subunit ribosomal protein L11
MPKEIKAILKLQIPAGAATPAPPVGPALAQHGLNIAEFCKKFNDMTKDQKGYKVSVKVTVFEDRTYTFKVAKAPLTADLLKKAAGVEKGSGEANKKKVGNLTKDQIKKIAKQKMADLNTEDIKMAIKIVSATAKNIGIEIEK